MIVAEPLIWSAHMDIIVNELQQVNARVENNEPKQYDLVINVPPGTTKSSICTIMYPVWAWTRSPHQRFITASYSAKLSTEHSQMSRDIVESELYQELFPYIKIRYDKSGKTNYENTRGGQRYSTSVGGSITGSHGHQVIIDDPLNVEESESEAERATAMRWMDKTIPTRVVDKAVTPIILIMQRLHEDDPTGHMLKQDVLIRHICLPAQLSRFVKPESAREIYENGLLDPVRLPQSILQVMRIKLGSYGYAGQFDQNPSPDEGGILKRNWFQIIDRAPQGIDYWDQVIDPAYTKNEKNDPSAIMTYAEYEDHLYVKDVQEVWMEFPNLIKFIVTNFEANGCDPDYSRIYVEPKASGKDIVNTLKLTNLNIMESINPTKDKVARVKDISAKVQAGKVILIRGDWNEAFIDQCAVFQNGTHDDQVDCLVISVNEALIGSTIEVDYKAILV